MHPVIVYDPISDQFTQQVVIVEPREGSLLPLKYIQRPTQTVKPRQVEPAELNVNVADSADFMFKDWLFPS